MKVLTTFIFTMFFSCYMFGQNSPASKPLVPAFKNHYFFKTQLSGDSSMKFKPELKKNLSFVKNKDSTTYNMPIFGANCEDKILILKPNKKQKYSLRIIESE